MGEVEPMDIDGAHERKEVPDGTDQKKKSLKRKRVEACLITPNPEEKQAKVKAFRDEINSLVRFCKDTLLESRGAFLDNVEKVGNCSSSLNSVIACLMEESDLPLSKLVDEIFEKVKGKTGDVDGVSKASVKSAVLIIGQRLCYGVTTADADILEDDAECALWCWETRDLKLMPKLVRASLKVRRTCRKKIQERIMAVSAMINALEKPDNYPNYPQELTKASEKLSKVLHEADIRLLIESMSQKNGAEMAEKEAKRKEKLIKQMEKNKREMEKERRKMDRVLQKEKLQSEKELKRLHDEAEKEERRRQKEEIDMQKQLKRQQEEAEKDQRRREKEEAEMRKQLALQKQASLMERFLKKNKNDSTSQNDSSMSKATTSWSSSNMLDRTSESVTLAMDSVLVQNGGLEVEDIWKSHLNAWCRVGHSIRSSRKMRWGNRQKPKTELVKELKLTTNKELSCDEDFNVEKSVGGSVDPNLDGRLSQMNTDSSPLPCSQKRLRAKQLLQFDKSYRPAFYGVWSRKSQVVGPRHPLVKDPDIDYEIDSDEEWEEDEPGESLSDSEKDEEDESTEAHLKEDDEEESEDGFFVPDGYLSENEGVKADEVESDDLVEESMRLKKNQPLIVLNLMHEKTTSLSAEELTGTEKLERMCLQTLSLRPLPGFPDIEISTHNDVVDEDQEASSAKSSTRLLATAAALVDSDLPQIISVIKSCPHSIGKITKSLHNKFPAVPKTQIRNKVREISEFSDNRWQVKKEILIKHGLSISPEKPCGKTKSIATFLKRCLPPSGTTLNLSESSPQSSQKCAAALEPPRDISCEHR
ncbi:Chromatin assembly factor 1 subunit FAS1 [Sesamum alatum]|uniref:Chromatin assembly factor 1 subunit FAS1 n=1 Tax=Sesamum alatum TaxID=300844 RepID=A0AAE1YTV4_9LAMI|nr:Chromatin assembly factor 1 subunit FAS1 [Sesamum alatum]